MLRIFLITVLAATLSVASSAAEKVGYDQYEYWPDGKTKECRMYTSEGRLLEKAIFWPSGVLQYDEKYDRYGNKIEESHYDAQGKLHPNLDGWAAARWRYVDNVVREEVYFGDDGNILQRNYYSESGTFMAKQYAADAQIDPYEEFDPAQLAGLGPDRSSVPGGRARGAMYDVGE